MDDFIQTLNTIDGCYIYGAGVVGYYTAKWILINTRITIKNILVTNRDYNVDHYFGVSVKAVDELDEKEKDNLVIIATLESSQEQIREGLKIKGFFHTYSLSNTVYNEIRNMEPEMCAEQYQYLCYMNRELKTQIGIHTGKLNNRLINLETRVSKLQERLNVYQGYNLDKTLYMHQFAQFRDHKEYWKKIEDLINGLTQDEVNEVYRILHRLNLLESNKNIIYSKQEESVLDDIDENFYKKIYIIDSNRMIYNDYILPSGHFEVSVFWYEHGLKLLKSIENIYDKDVIDAGAYIGDSALILSKYFTGNIYSFEPDKENYNCLKRTLELNNKGGNIIPVNMALTDFKGKINLYGSETDERLYSSTSVMETSPLVGTERKSTIYCTTVDEYVETNQIKVGLIKTDVEGSEQNLLKGAIKTIRNQKPTMIISIYHNLNDFFEIKPWIENLQLGYKFRLFRPIIKDSFMTETVLICEAR